MINRKSFQNAKTSTLCGSDPTPETGHATKDAAHEAGEEEMVDTARRNESWTGDDVSEQQKDRS
jgi:hypothetical protein